MSNIYRIEYEVLDHMSNRPHPAVKDILADIFEIGEYGVIFTLESIEVFACSVWNSIELIHVKEPIITGSVYNE